MSTYDWIERHRGPCRCGNGQFIVEDGTPDHPYPTSAWSWRHEITCANCRQKYDLTMQDGQVIVVRRDELQKRQAASKEWHKKHEALLHSPKVDALLAQAEKKLEGYTLASAHCAVDAFTHVPGTVQTFRKHVRQAGGIGKWLRGAIQTGDVLKLAQWLKQSDADLEAQVSEVQALWKEARAPLPAEGAPLYRP